MIATLITAHLLFIVLKRCLKKICAQDLSQVEGQSNQIESIVDIKFFFNVSRDQEFELVFKVLHIVEYLHKVTHLHRVILRHEEGKVNQWVNVLPVNIKVVRLLTATIFQDVVPNLVRRIHALTDHNACILLQG